MRRTNTLMTKILLAPVLLLAMAFAAEAQIIIDATNSQGNRTIRFTYTGGFGYGYRYVRGDRHHPAPGTHGQYSFYSFLPGYTELGTGRCVVPYRYVEGRARYYSGPAYGAPGIGVYSTRIPMSDVNLPTRRSPGVADRTHEFVAGRDVEETGRGDRTRARRRPSRAPAFPSRTP